MREITSPAQIIAKAALFIFLGLLAATVLIARDPALQTAALLAVTVWAFARAYFFAFTVIEKYIDPDYRFAGLVSAIRWLVARRRRHTPKP